jgi:hypothetical protein
MPSKTSPPQTLANQLLEAHIQHELTSFSNDQFITWAKNEADFLHQWMKSITFQQLVSRETIKSVVRINVVERDIPGSIAEIAGEAAAEIFNAQFNKEAKLSDIMSSHQFEEWVDKFLELKEQRKEGLNQIIDLPIYSDLISDIIYQAIVRYIYETNILSKKVPGVSSMLKLGKKMMDKAAPKMEGAWEENIKAYISNNIGFLLRESKTFLEKSLTDEQIKLSAMEIWDKFADKPLGKLQEGMSSLDLSEFVVLGYEFWLRFRKTTYFQNCYETVIDYLFDKYGDSDLELVLEEFNVTPENAIQELELLAPQILDHLKATGHLEAILRRKLASFYHSEAALNCLKI